VPAVEEPEKNSIVYVKGALEIVNVFHNNHYSEAAETLPRSNLNVVGKLTSERKVMSTGHF
jgi:hypothetical protein